MPHFLSRTSLAYLAVLVFGVFVAIVALPAQSAADTEVNTQEVVLFSNPDYDFRWGCGYLTVDVWCVTNGHYNLKRVRAVETADQGANDSVCARTTHSGTNLVKACAIEEVTVFPPNVNLQRPGYKWGCCYSAGQQALNILGFATKR